MSYEDDIKREQEEAEQWLKDHEDEIDPVVEDEIDGEEVVSYESLEGTDDEPSCDPYGDEDEE